MELCDKALKVFVFMASCQNTLIISAPAWVVRSLRAGEGNSQLLKDEPPRIDMRRLTSPEELICDLYDGTKQGVEEKTPLAPQQKSQQVCRLLMAVTAHFSNAITHGCDAQYCVAPRPGTIFRLAPFVQFLSATHACPTGKILISQNLLSLTDPDKWRLCCNTQLVAVCAVKAWLGTSR